MPSPTFSLTITTKAEKLVDGGAYFLSKDDITGWKPTHAGIAKVFSKKGKCVATAFASPRSRYFLRIIGRRDEKISVEFWQNKISKALGKRKKIFDITDAYRVVFSEADEIPSVVIDKFGDIVAVQITSAGAEAAKEEIFQAIIEELKPATVVEKNNCSGRKSEELSLEDKVVFGKKTTTDIFELDQKFIVDVMAGQKTGAYLDYRNIRFAARKLARGKALDLFSYHGWLSCHVATTADGVTTVDASEAAINFAKQNAKKNGLKNISFICDDAFDFIKSCDDKFDFIHIDPPAMAKTQKDLMPAISGYKKLLASALRCANDRAIIMISSCSHRISERILEETVLDAVKKSGKTCNVVWRGIQDSDHPVAKNLPESLYLKAIAVELG